MNPEIMMHNGKVIDLFDPDPDLLDINVIARSLSRQCRFYGHTKRFYSVAEHCVLVSAILPPELKLWGLLHDAAEAFLGDVSSPLKRSPIMAGYRQAERVMEQAILRKFGALQTIGQPEWLYDLAAEVKRADMQALATEILYVAPGSPEAEYWRRHNDLPDPVVTSWTLGLTFGEAEDAYLKKFAEVS